MICSWWTRLIALLAILIAIPGCIAPPDPLAHATAAPPEPQPIDAGPGGSHPIVFQKVLFRIPAGTPLAVIRLRGQVIKEDSWNGGAEESERFNVSATDELKRLHYDVKDAADAVFTPGSTAEARFQIAAIVHAVSLEYEVKYKTGTYQTQYENVWSSARMEIEFQVFDSVAKTMVSTTRVSGQSLEYKASNAPMPKAFVAALHRAFSDPAFVAPLLKSTPNAVASGATLKEAVAVKRCSNETFRLPSDLPRIQDAVVVVVVGAGTGTGTIVSEDGFVLTAAHVVGAQSEAVLRFKSGLELPANVVRVDSGRDAALLKAPGRGHACLRTEPASVKLGSEIWAIGNPIAEELARSVTRGVASGNRIIHDRSYLQTDAAVNPGNSGGPLVDGQGLIRGIVVEKVSGPGIDGLGFAVPIADAENALGLHWK